MQTNIYKKDIRNYFSNEYFFLDIIRGNVITQSNNSTEDEYEFIMDTTITFYERPNKPKSKLYLTIPLIILLAIMYNLRLFLCHWIDW